MMPFSEQVGKGNDNIMPLVCIEGKNFKFQFLNEGGYEGIAGGRKDVNQEKPVQEKWPKITEYAHQFQPGVVFRRLGIT